MPARPGGTPRRPATPSTQLSTSNPQSCDGLEEASLAPVDHGPAQHRAALAEVEGAPTTGKWAARLRQERIRVNWHNSRLTGTVCPYPLSRSPVEVESSSKSVSITAFQLSLPRRLVSPKSDEGGSRTQAGAFQHFSFGPSDFCFLLSTFCFLLFPKRRFGALRPHAESPFVQKLRSDPDTG